MREISAHHVGNGLYELGMIYDDMLAGENCKEVVVNG